MTVWIVAIGLIFELGAVVFALVDIQMGKVPWLTGELQTVAACVLFGGLGGCTYCLRGVYLNACVYKRWDSDWLPWYFIRPIVSFVLGGISFLFLKSGLLLLGATQQSGGSPLGLLALSFLAGLNVDKFVEKIEGIGKSVWGVEPSRQSRSNEKKESD
jgi:hypothetical protein